MPAFSIDVDVGLFNLGEVVFELHEDNSISSVLIVADLSLVCGVPLRASVTPATMETVFTPRVSQLNESLSGGKLMNTDDDVSVALHKTI